MSGFEPVRHVLNLMWPMRWITCAVQADRAKLLPWSPAMAALFIDPSRLTQSSLLGISSSGRHTYSGTYRRTDSSLPLQVCEVYCALLKHLPKVETRFYCPQAF